MLSAAAMSAARASRSAPASASPRSAVDGCVPLMRARPSLAPATPVSGRPAPVRRRQIQARRRARLPFADQHEREVRQRRQVAAGADRSRDGTTGWTRWLSSASSRSSVSRRIPEKPFANIRPQRHRRAHYRNRQRLADAGGVAAQEIELQLRQRVVGDADAGKVAEPGIDPVGRRGVVRRPINNNTRGADTSREISLNATGSSPSRLRRDRRV